MVGNEFYDVVRIKMRCNWKSNWSVSSMETKNEIKQGENQQTVQLAYTQIVSKYSKANHKVTHQSYLPNSEKTSFFRLWSKIC